MSWPVRRRQRWWELKSLSDVHPMTAFLAGFFLCYLVGAVMMFHLLLVLNYEWQSALPRAAIWMWTARLGTDMLSDAFKNSPNGDVILPGTVPQPARPR